MKSLFAGCVIAAAAFSHAPVALADPAWTLSTRIVSLIAVDGLDVLRVQVQDTATNPGGCDGAVDVIDVQLDVEGRSAEEQRQLLNTLSLAFMTGRNVKLLVRDDICSTVGTSLRLRVATGVQIFY